MSERRNPDGSLSVGCLEDIKETVKEETAEKPKKTSKKK